MTAAPGTTLADLRRRVGDFPRVTAELGGRRAAAVAVVVSDADRAPTVLLTRRTTRLRTHPGQFALPGGRFDDGEDAVTAALRELREEVGVEASPDQVLGLLDDYPTRSGYVITPVVLCLPTVYPVANPAEVAEIHRLSFADLDVPPRLLTIPESDRPVIQLPLLGRMVHAPTAAVLYQFREVALHGRTTRVDQLEQPVWDWR